MNGTSGTYSAAVDRLKALQERAREEEARKAVEEPPVGVPAVEEVLEPRPGVAERLLRKYGLGQDPKKRRELYRRVEACCEAEGEAALGVVSSVVADAAGARSPALYFCSTVIRRLREAGLAGAASRGGDVTW